MPKKTIAVIIAPAIKIYKFGIQAISLKAPQAKGWKGPKDQQIILDQFGRLTTNISLIKQKDPRLQ